MPSSPPEFPRRDPADPDFWDLRYRADFAPWDAGRVPGQLHAFVASGPRSRVLVPGCGSAWDVRCFAEAGWDVVGIDFSHEALAAARAILGRHGDRVRLADFFAPIAEAPFEVMYERAFLCALPRSLWASWGTRAAELVAPGGSLAGFFYFDARGVAPHGDRIQQRGPPFALHSQEELDRLLMPAFARVEDLPVPDSIPVFAGKERWQVWRRR